MDPQLVFEQVTILGYRLLVTANRGDDCLQIGFDYGSLLHSHLSDLSSGDRLVAKLSCPLFVKATLRSKSEVYFDAVEVIINYLRIY